MTIAELWEYCVANGVTDHEIVVSTPCIQEDHLTKIDNIEKVFEGKIYLEGE